jgi:hypothetical protein
MYAIEDISRRQMLQYVGAEKRALLTWRRE